MMDDYDVYPHFSDDYLIKTYNEARTAIFNYFFNTDTIKPYKTETKIHEKITYQLNFYENDNVEIMEAENSEDKYYIKITVKIILINCRVYFLVIIVVNLYIVFII